MTEPGTAPPADVPTVSVDRVGDALRFRLDRPLAGPVEPLQEEWLQRVEGETLDALLVRADQLLHDAERRDLTGEAVRIGGLLHRALVPPALAAQLHGMHGPLVVRTNVYGVPWELFHDGDEFWGLRFALGRRVVTDRPVATAPPVRRSARPRALVIGSDPRGDLGFVPKEVETIAAALAPRADIVCVGTPLAALDTVIDYLGQEFDLVHFAGHVVSTATGDPGLLLGDGRVLAADMVRGALRGRPVVVLNACAGRRGTPVDRERTLSSVAHAFLFAGAIAVVATVADVDDRQAATLARNFYQRLLVPEPLGEALRGAREDCRAHPSTANSPIWLSFVLYGSPTLRLTDTAADGRSSGSGSIARRTLLRRGALVVAGATVAALAVRVLSPPPPPREVVVGVMAARRRIGDVPAWMGDFTRYAVNTMLEEVPGVSVFSQEKIDFLCQGRGLCGIAGAETLGMTKMLTPWLSVVGDRVVLEVEVVDVARNGLLDAVERVQGRSGSFIELQNALMLKLLDRLALRLTVAERTHILAGRTDDMLESYRMLVETLGGAPPLAAPEPGARQPWRWTVREAMAADSSADDTAIRAVLAAYVAALGAKDVDAVARLQVAMSADQRAALERYFERAVDLAVELSGVEVLIEGSRAVASYVRQDHFTEARTGRPVALKVKLSTPLRKVGDAWRLELPP